MDRDLSTPLTPFVGRDVELAELCRRLDLARGGLGGVILVSGEPGIGKTRLAEELTRRAKQSEAVVLWGRCYEGEGAPAFWPWAQAIRGAIRDRDAATLRAEMGPGASDIAEVVPEIRAQLPDLVAPPPLEPAQARFRFFASTASFFGNLSRGHPVILILDDLHWADTPSLLLLHFLAREARQSRLLVVGTYRDGEVGQQHPLKRTLAELIRLGYDRHLPLRGLTESDITRVIGRCPDRRGAACPGVVSLRPRLGPRGPLRESGERPSGPAPPARG